MNQYEKEMAELSSKNNKHSQNIIEVVSSSSLFKYFLGGMVIFGVCFVCCLFVFQVLLTQIGVEGYSMQPTINASAYGDSGQYNTDSVYYTKSKNIEYKDIVIIKGGKTDSGDKIIKRVIATPGQTITLKKFKETLGVNPLIYYNIYINGKKLSESYISKESLFFFFCIQFSRAGLALGLNLARFEKGDLGQHRADKLVDQHGKERDVGNDRALGAKRFGLDGHTERHACLRQKGDAEIAVDIFIAMHGTCAERRTCIFAERARKNVNDTDDDDRKIGKDRELELRTAEHEEQDKEGRRPTVETIHQLLGEVADVAEDRTEHHADKQRGKSDMYAADLKFEHRERDGQEYKGDRHRKTLGARMEEALEEGEQQSHDHTEQKREHDLKDRLDDDRQDVDSSRHHGLGDAEGNGEQHKSYRIVEGDDGEQNFRYRALRLILTHDHERRGGSGGRSNSAQHNGGGKGKLIGHQEVQTDQERIDEKRGKHRLKDADDRCLLARFFQVGQTELVADGKGDKAEGNVADDRKLIDLLHRAKAEAGYADRTQQIRSDEDTCNQIRSDSREL